MKALDFDHLKKLIYSIRPFRRIDNITNLGFFQGDVVTLEAVHGRELPVDRRAQPDQLQHSLRTQDAHDNLSGHGATRLHGLSLDHR